MTKNNIDSAELDSLNTLAAGLVHEIKNPLNAISINLQLLNEDLQNSNIEKDSKMSRRVRLLQNEVAGWIVYLVISCDLQRDMNFI